MELSKQILQEEDERILDKLHELMDSNTITKYQLVAHFGNVCLSHFEDGNDGDYTDKRPEIKPDNEIILLFKSHAKEIAQQHNTVVDSYNLIEEIIKINIFEI